MGILDIFKNKQDTREDYMKILAEVESYFLDHSGIKGKSFKFGNNSVEIDLDSHWASSYLRQCLVIFYILNYQLLNFDDVKEWLEADIRKKLTKTKPKEIVNLLTGISLLLETYEQIGYTNYNKSLYKKIVKDLYATNQYGFILDYKELSKKGFKPNDSYLGYIQLLVDIALCLDVPINKDRVVELIQSFQIGKGYYWSPMLWHKISLIPKNSDTTANNPGIETTTALRLLIALDRKDAIDIDATEKNIIQNYELVHFSSRHIYYFLKALNNTLDEKERKRYSILHPTKAMIYTLDQKLTGGKNKSIYFNELKNQSDAEWQDLLKTKKSTLGSVLSRLHQLNDLGLLPEGCNHIDNF